MIRWLLGVAFLLGGCLAEDPEDPRGPPPDAGKDGGRFDPGPRPAPNPYGSGGSGAGSGSGSGGQPMRPDGGPVESDGGADAGVDASSSDADAGEQA